MRTPRILPFTLLCAAILLAAPGKADLHAQPAPSFIASCETLEAELEKLNPPEGKLVTFDVIGKLRIVEFDGALAYMGMCAAPHPRVMCITYSVDGWKTGDIAVLSGHYNRGSAGDIILDPCLHYPPKDEDLKLLKGAGE